MASLMPQGKQQYFSNAGAPLVGGKVYTYAAGTTTPLTTYSDSGGSTPNANPVILDSRGEASIFFGTANYKIVLKDSTDATIWTQDNLAGSLSGSLAASTGATLVNYLPAQSGAAALTVQDALRMNFNLGNQTPVAGTSMKIDALMETGAPNFPLKSEAGIWSGTVYSFAGISKEFTVSDGSANAPCVGLFVFANNNNSSGDVVAVLGDAVARVNNKTVFGANFIVRNAVGTTGTKLVGLEVDVEPSAGTTVSSSSAGIYVNAFSISMAGPVLQSGGVSGGKFGNGILLDGIASTGAGLAPVGGASMDSLFNSGSGVYTTAAGIFANTHKMIFQGNAANAAYFFNDSSNFFHIVGGSAGTVIRNNADSTSLVSVANGGVVSLCSTGTINWDIAQSGTTVGAAGAASAPPATPEKYISVQVAGVAYRIPAYK